MAEVNLETGMPTVNAALQNAKMLETASLAIIVCGLTNTQKDISEGYFPQDCAAATQNILI